MSGNVCNLADFTHHQCCIECHCCTTALNAWDRIGEIGQKIESFAKVMQDPEEAFTVF